MRIGVMVLAGIALGAGCSVPDGGALDGAARGGLDAGHLDGFDASAGPDGGLDGGSGVDGGAMDAGDAGGSGFDAGAGGDGGSGFDASAGDDGGRGLDAGADAGVADAGTDGGVDGGTDAGPPNGGCISGASGTHVARFRWEGSGPGSTAYVVYEANTLPDRARWHAGAYSRGPIGSYRPAFVDTFLGEGGLELSGTTFIDVELSTAGLAHVSNATIAIYGRSYATTSSGSFSWMTFDGSGASPYGGVSNSAPYEWYPADATVALPAGNGGVLLRIEAGPPSGSLVVRRVEICFDAL